VTWPWKIIMLLGKSSISKSGHVQKRDAKFYQKVIFIKVTGHWVNISRWSPTLAFLYGMVSPVAICQVFCLVLELYVISGKQHQ
jgi:hypothetical protein